MADARQLLEAIQAGDDDEVEALLDAEPTLASASDENGVSAVLHALYRGRPDLAERCLAAGHGPNLHECICLGLEAQVHELLGADPDGVRSWSPDGFLPLHLAAFFGQSAIARMLLDAGADPDAKAHNAMAVRPLHSAAAGRHVDVATLLLERGASPNTGQAGGYTPLMSAAGTGDVAMIEALLRAGADAAMTADDGRTAAALARERDYEEVLPLLRGTAE